MRLIHRIRRIGERYLVRVRDFLTEREQLVVMWLLFFVIASTSFALGYLVAQQSQRASIIIEQSNGRSGEV